MSDSLPIVAPEEAIRFFRSKGLAIGFAWQDVWQEEHARSFTVAKAMSRDLLEDIRGEVDKALAEGKTLDQFREELKPILEKKGWWGRRSMVDPLTGEQKNVQLGSPRRLKTIFEVNMRSAYAAGRWERAQRNKKGFPFLRYVTVGDARVRPEHRAWHGVIRPIDDAFWDTHFPPCGWNCRCTAVPVSKAKLERRGWEVTDNPPAFPPKPYLNPRTGEVTRIEGGIDPGFSFNIGKSYLSTLTPRPAGPGGGAPPAAAVERFLEPFGTTAADSGGKVFFDRGGMPLAISPAWFRSIDGSPAAPGKLPARGAAELLGDVGSAIASPDMIRNAWSRGDDGRLMLVRRYFAMRAGRVLLAEVDRAGWRFRELGEVEAFALARDGTTAWSAGDSALTHAFVAKSLSPGREAMRSLDIGRVSAGQSGRLGKLGIPAGTRSIALDASRVFHALRLHGADRREGKALSANDVARAAEIFNLGKLSKGTPFARRGIWRVRADAKIDGVDYGGAFEIRRDRVVLVTLYRK